LRGFPAHGVEGFAIGIPRIDRGPEPRLNGVRAERPQPHRHHLQTSGLHLPPQHPAEFGTAGPGVAQRDDRQLGIRHRRPEPLVRVVTGQHVPIGSPHREPRLVPVQSLRQPVPQLAGPLGVGRSMAQHDPPGSEQRCLPVLDERAPDGLVLTQRVTGGLNAFGREPQQAATGAQPLRATDLQPQVHAVFGGSGVDQLDQALHRLARRHRCPPGEQHRLCPLHRQLNLLAQLIQQPTEQLMVGLAQPHPPQPCPRRARRDPVHAVTALRSPGRCSGQARGGVGQQIVHPRVLGGLPTHLRERPLVAIDLLARQAMQVGMPARPPHRHRDRAFASNINQCGQLDIGDVRAAQEGVAHREQTQLTGRQRAPDLGVPVLTPEDRLVESPQLELVRPVHCGRFGQ
jgi:hypothetical protein